MARRLIVPLVVLLLAISALPASAIDGGVPDGARHPNVGLLGFDIDGAGPTPPILICAGSVISDRAFLAAAHCIENAIVDQFPGSTWAVTLEGGSPSAPVMPGGSEYPACCFMSVPESSIARATGVVVDPLFDVATFTSPTGGMHDLAVIEFPAGTFAGVTPVDVVRPGALEHLGAAGDRHGPQVTVVGFGAELRDGALYIPGYRKTGRATVVEVTDAWLVVSQDINALPRGATPCAADSGSPLFLGGSNIEVAAYHTAEGCYGVGYAQRLDTPVEQQFLAPYLP